MYLGGRLERRVGPRPSAYVGAAIVSGCTYLSSRCTTLRSLAFLQALVGAGIGLSYSAPILCGFGHLGGDNRGIVSGIVTTGSGVGPFLAGLVATTFVNGENYPVDAATGLYDPSSSPVVGRVPDMFRVLGTMYAVVGFVGATLLIPSGADGGARDEDGNDGGAEGGGGEGATLLTDGVGFDLYHDRSATREDDGCGKEESATTKRSTVKSILRSSNETRTRGHQRYGSRVKIDVRFELTTTQMINDSLSWLVVGATVGFLSRGDVQELRSDVYIGRSLPHGHWVPGMPMQRRVQGGMGDDRGSHRSLRDAGGHGICVPHRDAGVHAVGPEQARLRTLRVLHVRPVGCQRLSHAGDRGFPFVSD